MTKGSGKLSCFFTQKPKGFAFRSLMALPKTSSTLPNALTAFKLVQKAII